MIVVVTGHRPDKLWNMCELYHPFYCEIGKEMRRFLLERIAELKESEKLILVSGMALGADILFAKVGYKLRSEYPKKIELHCYLPCEDQMKYSRGKIQYKSFLKAYDELLINCDIKKYISKKYMGISTMYKRDEAMIDFIGNKNGYLLSLWNGYPHGGTYHTIDYAETTYPNIKRYNIDPRLYQKYINN